jgi:ABC-type bacteriocin/lantibiotic exporter with double-glycine peptidase domain
MYEDASQVATDAIISIRTVASFCSEKRITRIYDQKCEASMNQGIRTGIVGGIGFGFSFLMTFLTYGLCFYVGGQFVRHGKSNFGDVFEVCKCIFSSIVFFKGTLFPCFIFVVLVLVPPSLTPVTTLRGNFT